MLQAIRDRATGSSAWIIVILISIPFALWGVHEYFGGGGEPVVAEVDGSEITLQAYQQALFAQRERMRELLGPQGLDVIQDELLRKQVLEALVEEAVLVSRARDLGLAVGDSALAAAIQARPEFQRDGRFDRALYEARLRSAGLSAPAFEALVRRGMLIAQLRGAVERTGLATPGDVEALLRIQGERREGSLVTVPAAPYLDQVEVREAEIARYYEAHKAEFVDPERVRIAYVDLSLDEVAKDIPVDEDALRALYEEEKARLVAPEERRAAHILIPVPEGADPDTEARARARAEALLARIRNGEDFAKLAREHSGDPGSAAQGGDLGFVGRGVLERPFGDALFAIERPGGVAGPVRTRFGYHIIKLLEVRGGRAKPFEAVREELARELRRRQAEARFYELADTLANVAYEQPDSLEPAAKAVGLPVRESGWFTAAVGEGIAADPRIRNAAFSDTVREGNNSDPIELGPDRVVVLRVIERRPARQRPLDEVADEIRERLRRRQAAERARAAADAVIAAVRAGKPPAEAARGVPEAKVDGPRTIGRGEMAWPVPALRWLFRLPAPETGGTPQAARVALPQGDYAVVIVHRVEPGDPAKAKEADRKGLREAVARARGEAAVRAAIAVWRARADVRVFEEVVAEAGRP